MLGRRTGSSPSERAAFLPAGRRALSLEAGFQPDPASSHPAIQSVNPAHPAAGCLGRGWIQPPSPRLGYVYGDWIQPRGGWMAGGGLWQERLLCHATTSTTPHPFRIQRGLRLVLPRRIGPAASIARRGCRLQLCHRSHLHGGLGCLRQLCLHRHLHGGCLCHLWLHRPPLRRITTGARSRGTGRMRWPTAKA